jgi:hypothetical protein
VADAIVAGIAAGDSFAAAAKAAGVGARTLRTWRSRAWSREPADRACVDLERRLQRALASRQVAPVQEPAPWEQLAANLVADQAWWREFEAEFGDA